MIALHLRCATCKHWEPFDPGLVSETRHDANRLGLCRKASGHNEHDIERDDYYNAIPEEPRLLAMAVDGSDYCRQFRTAAEFGCVLWEAKS